AIVVRHNIAHHEEGADAEGARPIVEHFFEIAHDERDLPHFSENPAHERTSSELIKKTVLLRPAGINVDDLRHAEAFDRLVDRGGADGLRNIGAQMRTRLRDCGYTTCACTRTADTSRVSLLREGPDRHFLL